MSATQNNIVAAFIERSGWAGITSSEAQALAKLVTHADDDRARAFERRALMRDRIGA